MEKKLKKIKIWSIVQIIAFFLMIPLFIIGILLMVLWTDFSTGLSTNFYLGIVFVVISGISILLAAITRIISSIYILVGDWDQSSDSLLWGLLDLTILGGIAGLIFVSKAKNSI